MSPTPNSPAADLQQANADLQRQLAEARAERDESEAQKAAITEVLGVINSSPGDLAPVFDAMLEKAMRLCAAAFGYLETYDGEHFHPVATRGLPAAYADYLPQRDAPGSSSSYAQILGGAPYVHVADLREGEAYHTSPLRQALVDLGGARSSILVALRREDVLLGSLVIYRREVRPFSEKEIALLQNFAAQAVIAMENARLLGELRQRTDEVAELNRGLQARVAEQVDELGRVGRLKRFLAPQLAELIVSQGDEQILESHRREIVVVFCDLRGYTAFTETAEPEEVLDFLREYHAPWGRSSVNSKGRLTSSQGMGSWYSSTIRCPVPIRPNGPSRWRWRCAKRRAR
jgi:GAF domain-containing protein